MKLLLLLILVLLLSQHHSLTLELENHWDKINQEPIQVEIRHHMLYVQHSHTEQVNLHNMLSTSSACLLQLTCIFMIMLYFLTKLFTNVLVLTETWSSQISISSSNLDQPIWTQLVLLSSNTQQQQFHQINPLVLLAKRFLNPATTGMRGCTCLRVLSVTGFMFAASAFSLGIKVLTAHQNNETPSYPLDTNSVLCPPTIFQPP